MKFLPKIGLIVALATNLASPQNTRVFLKQLVGQRLILRHYTGSSRGDCDLAVEVKAITLEKASVLVQVRNIGEIEIPTSSNKNYVCANVDVFSFHINGFDADQPPDQAEKIIGSVLQTPEAYLAAFGISWKPSTALENESPVDISSPGLTIPKVLLSVSPYYPGTSRMDRNEGTVTVSCVIGADGIVHDPVIVKGVTKELNKLAIDALTFYRSAPAREAERAVAVKTSFQFSFKLH